MRAMTVNSDRERPAFFLASASSNVDSDLQHQGLILGLKSVIRQIDDQYAKNAETIRAMQETLNRLR